MGDEGAAVRTLDDLTHDELAAVVREYLLAGQLIDRAGMPTVIPRGVDVMAAVAIDEWMGASPIYTKRMQRLLGFEEPTVATCLKGMQLDIGAPPEFMDFRMEVIDHRHGAFHLDHCGALMDVEPMGEEFVVAMCHHIEDPTFDATGWATHPKLRMRPIHRPPRTPADRHPHCAWTVVIDESVEDSPEPEMAVRVGRSLAARLPLAAIELAGTVDGRTDYAGPLDPDLRLRDFATPVLRAMADEIALQAHLLVLAFGLAVEDRTSTEEAVDAIHRQFTGVAGVVAERLHRALGLGDGAADLATVLELHPAFHPRAYVGWSVTVDGGEAVHLALGEGPARAERGFASWITGLADGHDRALSAIAAAVDPHWSVQADGPDRWVATRGATPVDELPEVKVTRFSTGATHVFIR